ncbi:MAG: arginine--tRNA ligase [Halobacteriales archaeon]|nr:arginine--tRNA ligase [Halobacteriales archaeon]
MPPEADPLEPFRAEVERSLRAAVAALGVDGIEPKLARAPQGMADFAFAAHALAAKLRQAPPAIAQQLAQHAGSERVRAVPEGPYVNFRIDDAALTEAVLASALARGEHYGDLPKTGQRVIVEHTSANPTGPFHVGRARNPILGDALARIVRAAGHDVTTEYYVNDMGKQVITLTWGLQHLRPEDVPHAERDKPDHQLVARYRKASELLERDPVVAQTIQEMLQRYEGGEPSTAQQVKQTVETMLRGMNATLERMGIRIDQYAWESRYVFNGDVDRTLEKLKQSERCKEEDGAFYLDLEGLGVAGKSQKFFLTRKDGTTLYTTRDVAYHLDKFRRADRLVDVLGEDHKLVGQQLGIALGLVGETRKPDIVFYAFVNLPEGRMSTRSGRVVYIDDLMDEAEERARAEVTKRRPELGEEEKRAIARIVGLGALRFNIAGVQAEKAITFKWEEALDFEGASAPFAQYSHARAASILRKAREEGHAPGEAKLAGKLAQPNELALVRTIARLPSVVRQSAADTRVHPLAGYAIEVANAFNQFYRDSPVLQAEPEVRGARLALTLAAKHALRNSLGLLGVEAPESM